MNNLPNATAMDAFAAMNARVPDGSRATEPTPDRAAFDMTLALAAEDTVVEQERLPSDEQEEEGLAGAGEVPPYFAALVAQPPAVPESALLAFAALPSEAAAPLAVTPTSDQVSSGPTLAAEPALDEADAHPADMIPGEAARNDGAVDAELDRDAAQGRAGVAAMDEPSPLAPSETSAAASGSGAMAPPKEPAAAPKGSSTATPAVEPPPAVTSSAAARAAAPPPALTRAATMRGPLPARSNVASPSAESQPVVDVSPGVEHVQRQRLVSGPSASVAVARPAEPVPAADTNAAPRVEPAPQQVPPSTHVTLGTPSAGDAGPAGLGSARAGSKRSAREGGVEAMSSGAPAVSTAPVVEPTPSPVGAPAEGVKTVAVVNVPAPTETIARASDHDIESGIRAAEAVGHRRAFGSEARGRIELPELGAVEVRASAEPTRVDVHVEAEQSHAKSLLLAHAPELAAHVQREVPEARIHVERTFVQPHPSPDPGTMRDFASGQRERGREPNDDRSAPGSRGESSHVGAVTPRAPKARVRIVL